MTVMSGKSLVYIDPEFPWSFCNGAGQLVDMVGASRW